ncbi:uncharacterized protein METZ01_LOCUS205506 [marine metagenome]|jgi:hypothetical protein|uniref:Uncharacterized protein n=1 Tax=marine metagenome TaxID=408172 RepID=A0A382EQP0_9ZZZZ|tara:strand:+ start:216 stop:341 length:126 start_codon:yes stop_codon:yes gene_type:complete
MDMSIIAWIFLLGAIGYGIYSWTSDQSSIQNSEEILSDEEE